MTTVPAASHPSPPEHPERPDGAVGRRRMPRWPAWTAPAAMVSAFAGATVVAVLIGLVGGAFGASLSDPPPAVSITAIVGQDLCLIGAALLFARMVARPEPWQFGLQRPKHLRSAFGWIVAGYVGFITFSYVWLAIIGQTDAQDTITDDLGADESVAALIAVTVVVTVLAPLAEEIFFRGYFFGALRAKGLWVAAGITGLAFGLVHVFGSPIAFIVPLAVLGMLLCLLRERTGSLYPGVALHCINNAAAMSASEHWGWEVPVVLFGSLAAIAALLRLGVRGWQRSLA